LTMTTGIQTYLNYIGGKWVPASTGEVEASINPANRHDVVGYVQLSGRDDLEKAVAAAKNALSFWRKRSGPERGEFLHRMANILERRADEIAKTMTREMGKTLPEAKGETARGVALLRYYAGEGMRKVGDVIPSTDSGGLMFTTRVPLGVVGVITPWNFPVAIPLWKMAPALAYGNTVVFKPAEEAAVTATKLVECMEEAGLPAGVVNLVMGSGPVIGQGIVDHPDISGITFTGSNEVGRRVGQRAVARGAKYQLEMGGKNPVIVLEDADLDRAVEATVSGGMRTCRAKVHGDQPGVCAGRRVRSVQGEAAEPGEGDPGGRRDGSENLDGTARQRGAVAKGSLLHPEGSGGGSNFALRRTQTGGRASEGRIFCGTDRV